MIVYSFQYLQDIDDSQNVNIYSLSALDKLVEDYYEFIKNNFGNLEMFYEDYDNNPDYTYDNYEKAYNDMLQHPKFKILSKSEKYDITEFIPMPLSVEKIIFAADKLTTYAKLLKSPHKNIKTCILNGIT